MIVLDASVILKWFFDDEDRSQEASKYREGHISGEAIAAVPDLLYYEIANVLAVTGRIPPEESAAAFSLLWDFQLERFDFGIDEFSAAMNLAREQRITLYDAAYVELARRLGCRLVTADKKLFEKTKNLGVVDLL